MLDLLSQHGGRMLINLPVGVGKSYSIDEVVEAALADHVYDLVIVLSPTWYLINDRRWVRNPPQSIVVRQLKPRPANKCGAMDAMWSAYEQRGMAMYAKQTLCTACPQRNTCTWPGQYGARLKGAQVIYAAQAHLRLDSQFLPRIIMNTGATNPLVLLDEDKFIMCGQDRRISKASVLRYLDVLVMHFTLVHIWATFAWYG
jgi:hypothetical protein